MANGRNYNTITDPATSDQALVWDVSASEWVLVTLGNVQTLFEANATTYLLEPVTQYSAPLTGFSVSITDGSDGTKDVHLILTPAGTLATGTIVLPTSPRDKQTVLVSSTNEVTALTVDGGTATVQGGPTTIAANGYFKLKYDTINTTWYRVG